MPITLFSTFFEFTTSNQTEMIDTAKSFLTDLSPVIIPLLAVGLGAIIVSVVINAIKK